MISYNSGSRRLYAVGSRPFIASDLSIQTLNGRTLSFSPHVQDRIGVALFVRVRPPNAFKPHMPVKCDRLRILHIDGHFVRIVYIDGKFDQRSAGPSAAPFGRYEQHLYFYPQRPKMPRRHCSHLPQRRDPAHFAAPAEQSARSQRSPRHSETNASPSRCLPRCEKARRSTAASCPGPKRSSTHCTRTAAAGQRPNHS